MITNKLPGLLYQQPEDMVANPFAFPQGLMMLAQAQRVPAGMQKQIIENDPELFGPRQPSAQPASQGGGYKLGSDYVHKPKSDAEIEAWRRKVIEDAIKQRQLKR